MKNDTLTFDEANRLFTYDCFTGELRWSDKREDIPELSNKAFSKVSGKEAGCIDKRYRKIRFQGKTFMTHRVAWLLVWGEWPPGEIDHVNGNGLDNRIENLRNVTPSENQRNRRISRNNTSGVTGVAFDKYREKWVSHIGCNEKSVSRRFNTKEEAIAARAAMNVEFGYHELHGTTKD